MLRSRHLLLLPVFALAALLSTSPASAQDWAGKARLQGSVNDPQGHPVEGAKVSFHQGADSAAPGPPAVLTDKSGHWAILGLANGPWRIVIEKEGFVTSEGDVKANEFAAAQPINVTLKAAVQQAPAAAAGPSGTEIMGWIQEGNTLLQEKKYAEARAQYEKALAQLQPANQPAVMRGIAATYYEEKNVDKAVETLKAALEIKPDDPDMLKLLVSWLVASGREEEAKTYMAKLPAGTTVDPNSLLNLGIKAYNEKKLDDAAGYFNRVVSEHPELPDGYYYRGLVELAQNKTAEAKADFQKLLEIAPTHPKAAEVKEYIKAL